MNVGLRYRNNSYILSTLDERGEYAPTYLDGQCYLAWDPDGTGPGNCKPSACTAETTTASCRPPAKPTSAP